MRIIRVLFGFVLACVAAAATLVLFVYTPAELASLPAGMGADRVSEAGLFALVVTPHVALFSALPALLMIIAAETRGISAWSFYVLTAVGIAVLGFLTQHFTESPGQITILHNYALMAFLTAGFVAGWVYWLLSGRFVARPSTTPPSRHARPPSADGREAAPQKA